MNVLVLGGSGFIGRHVCEKLAAAGHSITVPTRRLAASKHLLPLPRLTLAQADVHDEKSLAALVSKHNAVINLVAILHGDEARFERTHVALPQKIATACKTAGVRRLVHISALGAAPDAPSMYQRSKARGEAVLAEAGLDVTLLRPSVVFGAEDKFLNMFASLQGIAPFMPLAGGSTRFAPVWVEDVAQAVVNSLTCSDTVGKVYEACGPDVLSLRQIVQLAGKLAGCQRPVIDLPLWLGRAQGAVMEWLPGEPLMSRDNVDSLKADNVSDGKTQGLAVLGITPASVYAIAPTYIGAARVMDNYRGVH
jgi:uncharacterized protein YbjT (DUF2867 family)